MAKQGRNFNRQSSGISEPHLPGWRHENQSNDNLMRRFESPTPSSSSPLAIEGRTTTEQTGANRPLLGQKIKLSNESYKIKADFECSQQRIFAIESARQMVGYDGICPLCNKQHVAFPEGCGYYALATNIYKALEDQERDAEKVRGPPRLNELQSYRSPRSPLNEILAGRNKGIEGDSNSCYMDATIFCMFAYNDVFDTLLYTKPKENLARLQEILREYVVHVLREKNGFVQRHAMHYLRLELSDATGDPTFVNSEKDPSDFLKAFEKLFDYEPIKTIHPGDIPKSNLSNVTTNVVWEMFDMNPHNLLSINMVDIFRNSLAEIPARLLTVPPVLILIAPRHKRAERSYRYIVPDRQIVLDNDSLQLFCRKCDKTNPRGGAPSDFFSCDTCQSKASQASTNAIIECYCNGCIQRRHGDMSDSVRYQHKITKVEAKKHKLNLFAVLCIETSHYVAFVKCKTRDRDEQWLFFDSMSDRINNQTNIPSVSRVPDFDRWLDEPSRNRYFFEDLDRLLTRDPRPLSEKFNEDEMRRLRLFRDGAFFFYENATVDYQ